MYWFRVRTISVTCGRGHDFFVTPHVYVRPKFDIHWVHNFSDYFGTNWVPQYGVSVGTGLVPTRPLRGD